MICWILQWRSIKRWNPYVEVAEEGPVKPAEQSNPLESILQERFVFQLPVRVDIGIQKR